MQAELSVIIDPRPEASLDLDMLADAFEEAGFDPDMLGENLTFEDLVSKLVGSFYDAAAKQPALQGQITIGLLRGIAEATAAMVTESRRQTQQLANIASGIQQPHPLIEQAKQAEAAYLNMLRRDCNRLPLAEDDRSQTAQAQHRAQLSNVYVDLATQRSPSIDSIPARSTHGGEYPWNGDFDSALANTEESSLEQTTPVHMYQDGKSAEGVWDLVGNVWEWSNDDYNTWGKAARGGGYYNDSYIYVVGHTTGALPGQNAIGNWDAYLRKYDTNGAKYNKRGIPIWTVQLGFLWNDDQAQGLALDDAAIYITGTTESVPNQDPLTQGPADAFLAKFTRDSAYYRPPWAMITAPVAP